LPEKLRFLLIGGANTAFGLFAFAALYFLLPESVHYLIILVLANFVSVLFAYFMLKIFVFQTKGSYLKEFVRCYSVYLSILGLNAVLLFICVSLLHFPVLLSQIGVTVLLVIYSYIGHKKFSFRIS
jgi:putative flippase GtrA